MIGYKYYVLFNFVAEKAKINIINLIVDQMKYLNLFVLKAMLLGTMMVSPGLTVMAQNGSTVVGSVVDENGEPVIGATVMLKGHKGVATATDLDGHFKLEVPSKGGTLVFSYIGMLNKEARVSGKPMQVVMQENARQLNDVVVVGYGQQKKASVVGAITQTDAKTLDRYSGVPSLGQALTGMVRKIRRSSSDHRRLGTTATRSFLSMEWSVR